MKLVYTAVFTPCEEGGYTVTVPDLPGCITEGDNLAEALSMVEDAASGWVLDELEDGNKPPEASRIENIEIEAGQFKSVIALDMDEYAEKSCSKILQDAISQMAIKA